MVKEIKNKELKKISGGAVGYGNVQFVCECGKEYITDTNLLKHCWSLGHKSAKVYYQKVAHKSSRGNYIGKATITKNKSKGTITIKYPNGKSTTKKMVKKSSGGGDSISNWDLIN